MVARAGWTRARKTGFSRTLIRVCRCSSWRCSRRGAGPGSCCRCSGHKYDATIPDVVFGWTCRSSARRPINSVSYQSASDCGASWRCVRQTRRGTHGPRRPMCLARRWGSQSSPSRLRGRRHAAERESPIYISMICDTSSAVGFWSQGRDFMTCGTSSVTPISPPLPAICSRHRID